MMIVVVTIRTLLLGGYNTSSDVGSPIDDYDFTFIGSCGSGDQLKQNSAGVRCVRKGPAPRCVNPYGVEGEMTYNTTHDVVQYCDGARWVGIGKAL